MDSSTVVWIVIAVVAAAVIAALCFAAIKERNRRRRAKAEGIRERARNETVRADRREALAAEAAANARAAQAEAEAKSAEAARLQERAAAHQKHVAEAREQLDEQWKHADRIDPDRKPQKRTPAERGEGVGARAAHRARTQDADQSAETAQAERNRAETT